MNPVKAGIVKKESDYIYSSYNDYLKKTGFIHERILKFIFDSSNNYIEKFQSIEYKDLKLRQQETDLGSILNDFLLKERIDFQDINKNDTKKFICYLIANEYKFSKKGIAEILKISRATLYRWLNG